MTDPKPTLAESFLELAALYEALPDLPEPSITGSELTFHVWDAENAATKVREIARSIGGRWHKNDPNEGDYDSTYYVLTHDLKFAGRWKFKILTYRNDVCVRKEVGTEPVEIPAVEAQPARTEERTVYEWECVPLMAAAEAELEMAVNEITDGKDVVDAELVF